MIATYRLQLNKDFNFDNAVSTLDYLKDLGISHIYLSPVLRARPSSSHGYDVIDHSQINEELGGESGYLRLISEARKRSLGIIQDIVPNHMAVHSQNQRLMDLLEKWRESKYYDYFDHYDDDKLILPLLEDSLDKVIDEGKIRVEGKRIVYQDLSLPINQKGLEYLNQRRSLSRDELKTLLSLQHYDLRPWRESPNYRRFFAVNDLIAIRVELEHVFKESHDYITSFPVDGFRVDHIDGLYDPEDYLKRLAKKGKLIYVEKILGIHERVRESWPVVGTTGYDFLNWVNMILVDNVEEMMKIYEEFLGKKVNLEETIVESKRLIANTLFKSDIERLSKILNVDYEYLVDFLVCLKVYRSYSPEDKEIAECDKEGKIDRDKVPRLQQYMPAIFAKGYEDTALFRYNALISLNEVGSDLTKMKASVDELHAFNSSRLNTLSMNATSTHDTKFSEDVRARISVLSEIPKLWREKVFYWHDLLKPRVDRNDEYRLYQTLVGSYENSKEYQTRLKEHMIKVVREAKVNTTWENPNREYEEELLSLVDEVTTNRAFLNDFFELENVVLPLGYKKSLITLAIKVLSPGVPDFYQGTETWRFLLTDPDNRRPVDFKKLKELMKQLKELPEPDLQDERVKLWFTKRLLALRGQTNVSDYRPMKHGFRVGNVIVLFRPRVSERSSETVNLDGYYINVLTGEKLRAVDLSSTERYGVVVLVSLQRF
ncbi:MAG: malto-oligosyltrehalose synthase [Metallosphaera sp.]|uniref:malto-oligosyltrehalose synthase n=1 Tax=Metallosphaera sp. TaxID=2020860 RepID=UPI0031664BDC